MQKKWWLIMGFILLSSQGQAASFKPGTQYDLCFVPDGINCEPLLVQAIQNTKKQLLIQAYGFTSAPIAKAVIGAHRRGVEVVALLDKSQKTERYSSLTLLQNAGVRVLIDNKPAIAHNKIMIFDQAAVFTGSFNFTKGAATRNAENGILIRGDEDLVNAYLRNWLQRYHQSSAQ